MAGNPVARGKRDIDPNNVGHLFPTAPKPRDWQARAIADRLEHNLGLSIDRCYDVLSWPPEQCNHHMLAYQKEVAIAHIKAGFRYMLDRANSDDRERILDQMRKELAAHPGEGRPTSAARTHARPDAASELEAGHAVDTDQPQSAERKQHQ